jgi:hypothetical protein
VRLWLDGILFFFVSSVGPWRDRTKIPPFLARNEY